MLKRICVLFLLNSFILSSVLPGSAYAQALTLPAPGRMLGTSEAYTPLIFKGLQIQPDNPLLFDFIVDTGDTGLTAGKDDAAIRTESQKLIKYFLASLTLPEKDQWVNLSPYEQNRMMPAALEQTELGRDMLAQDYILKQVTASLIYPEKDLGKQFWSKVYAQVQEKFAGAEVPMDTFNKVWVVADKADVYVNNNTAFVVGSHLKLMLESDYLAAQKADTATTTASQEYTRQLVRDIVLPALENEVNTGKNFANLRQIFHAMILATWYKKNLKEALLNQVYSNKAKTNGVILGKTNLDPQAIFSKYVEAYKKGAFNLIKEDVLANGETVPRKYFSGGEAPNLGADKVMRIVGKVGLDDFSMKNILIVQTGLETLASDLAITAEQALQPLTSITTKTSLTPVLLLLGISASGKGTVGPMIAKNLNIPHFSTGAILRDEQLASAGSVSRETLIGDFNKDGGAIFDWLINNEYLKTSADDLKAEPNREKNAPGDDLKTAFPDTWNEIWAVMNQALTGVINNSPRHVATMVKIHLKHHIEELKKGFIIDYHCMSVERQSLWEELLKDLGFEPLLVEIKIDQNVALERFKARGVRAEAGADATPEESFLRKMQEDDPDWLMTILRDRFDTAKRLFTMDNNVSVTPQVLAQKVSAFAEKIKPEFQRKLQEVGDKEEMVCVFRSTSATHFGELRPVISVNFGHLFRSTSASQF